MLPLTSSFLWAVEGDGWIPFSDSDAEMQRGQEKVVLKANTPRCAVDWPSPASISETGVIQEGWERCAGRADSHFKGKTLLAHNHVDKHQLCFLLVVLSELSQGCPRLRVQIRS